MQDLFDNSVLRVVNISIVRPSHRDQERAERLIVGNKEVAGGSAAASAGSQEGPSTRPEKRPHRDPSSRGAAVRSDREGEAALGSESPSLPIAPRERRKRLRGLEQEPEAAVAAIATEAGQLEESSSEEGEEVGQQRAGAIDEAPGEGSSAEPAHRPGKELAEEGAAASGLAYPFLYRVDEIGEDWEHMRQFLIGVLGASPRYIEELDMEHRYSPDHYLDVRGSRSRVYQARAVEQFWLPRDDEFLAGEPSVGLHSCLQSYLVRGALIEQELVSRLERVRVAYLKLQGEVEALRAGGGDDLEWAMELSAREAVIEELKASKALKSAEVERLNKELHDSKRRARRLDEVLRERDRAKVQAEAEKQAAQHAKVHWEEEQVAKPRLQEEFDRFKESLALTQSRVDYLESGAYRSEIVEEYRQGLIGKAEVLMACKTGHDHLMVQLPAEMRSQSDHFRYHPVMARCLDGLGEVEELGGGFDLGEDDDEELDGEERAIDKGTKGDERPPRGASEGPSGERGEGVVRVVRTTTPPPTIGSSLPLTPGAGMDLSQ